MSMTDKMGQRTHLEGRATVGAGRCSGCLPVGGLVAVDVEIVGVEVVGVEVVGVELLASGARD